MTTAFDSINVGGTPVGHSLARARGQVFTTDGPQDFVVPRELSAGQVEQPQGVDR